MQAALRKASTSQRTHCVPITKTSKLMHFKDIINSNCENHTEHRNTSYGKEISVFIMLKQVVYMITTVF